MKNKKTFLLTIILIAFSFTIGFSQEYKVGEKTDDVLFTDITTFINGQQVESFNINGRTAIYIKEVDKLGFDYSWNNSNRAVRIKANENKVPQYFVSKLRKEVTDIKIGEKINDVLYTDIKTSYKENSIKSFNINNNTAIYITSLKLLGADVKWDSKNRKVIVSNHKDNINNNKIDIEGNIQLESKAELKEYLNKHFSKLNTSLGETEFDFWIIENDRITLPYDYWIMVKYDFSFIYDIKYSNKISENQRLTVKSELREYQKQLGETVIKLMSDKKITGGYYQSWYKYPNLKIDLQTWRFYTWNNHTNYNILVDTNPYNKTKINGFKWDDFIDDKF